MGGDIGDGMSAAIGCLVDARAAMADKHLSEVERQRKQAMSLWKQAEKSLNEALKETERNGTEIAELSKVPAHMRQDSASQLQCKAKTRRRAKGAEINWCVDRPTSPEADKAELPAPNPSVSPTQALADRHERALKDRAHQQLKRAAEARDRTANNFKRKLRAKITGILLEVKKRQVLEQQQAKARGFREKKERAGLGPSPSVGDADDHALGLIGWGGQVMRTYTLHGASPRRTRLLESLDFEELDMFRSEPRFYLQVPALLEGAANCSVGGRSAEQETKPDDSIETLVAFFTPSRQEKNNAVPASVFARRLREKLAAEASEIVAVQLPPPDSDRPFPDASTMSMTLEKMPCQGRRPAVFSDARSPTLMKVREVYNHKEQTDAKWLDGKREEMVRRLNLNEFKAKQQQRELQSLANRQKELHKERMLEAEERKALADATLHERWRQLDAEMKERMLNAHNQAVDAVEATRARASATLENWEKGAMRSEFSLRQQEAVKIRRAEEKWQVYMGRLWDNGRRLHSGAESQSQKNHKLRTQIQISLRQQLADEQEEESKALKAAVSAKLEAAERRRSDHIKGSRYNLVEKAFGAVASDYDPKYHCYHADRRSKAWSRSAAAWRKQRDAIESMISTLKRSESLPDMRRTM